MTEALLLALTGFLNISCFINGAKVGQTVSKGEKVEMPNLNPLKAVRESQARKEAEIKQDKLNTVLRNIDRYDGTSKGQEDVG
jgi:hypothetical protein